MGGGVVQDSHSEVPSAGTHGSDPTQTLLAPGGSAKRAPYNPNSHTVSPAIGRASRVKKE